MSAAFDTVDNEILLNRLNVRYGIEDCALKWIKSYLEKRTCSVVINQVRSDERPLKHGVPQGSVLGLLLFTMYLGPISDILEKHNMRYHLYADDIQIYTTYNVNLNDDSSDLLYKKSQIELCVEEVQEI